MSLQWTSHRFSGGLLALDLVNTVVCRSQPARRTDRFADGANMETFCEAAGRFRSGEAGGKQIGAPQNAAPVLELREAIDGWMRPAARGGDTAGSALRRLFEAAAACVGEEDREAGTVALGKAAAISAMRLFDQNLQERVKICPNCDWLFVDRSKNRSRIWCDMQVCGNRAKAGKHYRRRKGDTAGEKELAT